MNILQRIVTTKKSEVHAAKRVIPDAMIAEMAAAINRPTASLSKSILKKETGIIAEFKRRSPSKGEIKGMAQVTDIIPAYTSAGAAGISILTDTPYFGGAITDLQVARGITDIPLLRKEFIIDDYQIFLAKVAGADAILLIAAILSDYEAAHFTEIAHSLGLEVLFEVHSEEEVVSIPEGADLVGVNSRNLNNFETSLDNARRMVDKLPVGAVKIAESGIHSPADIAMLKEIGFNGFLIGEAFMSTPHPGETLSDFIKYGK